jgi:hypothetical protein
MPPPPALENFGFFLVNKVEKWGFQRCSGIRFKQTEVLCLSPLLLDLEVLRVYAPPLVGDLGTPLFVSVTILYKIKLNGFIDLFLTNNKKKIEYNILV